uniref:Uncharacterized protein n=1 Tax=Parascaris equorum TaxID=6256 RepID=A0A914R6D6_PAREQ
MLARVLNVYSLEEALHIRHPESKGEWFVAGSTYGLESGVFVDRGYEL